MKASKLLGATGPDRPQEQGDTQGNSDRRSQAVLGPSCQGLAWSPALSQLQPRAHKVPGPQSFPKSCALHPGAEVSSGLQCRCSP